MGSIVVAGVPGGFRQCITVRTDLLTQGDKVIIRYGDLLFVLAQRSLLEQGTGRTQQLVRLRLRCTDFHQSAGARHRIYDAVFCRGAEDLRQIRRNVARYGHTGIACAFAVVAKVETEAGNVAALSASLTENCGVVLKRRQ